MTHRGIQLDGRALRPCDPGPVPLPQWVPIDRLVIDDAYQRPLGRANWLQIERIAAGFRWSQFTAVQVAPLAGGLYAVIDGQHRVHAAALCGVTEVPALVVQIGAAEQARAFAAVNSQSIRVTPHHILKAALASGEGWALTARSAVEAAGCRLMLYHPSAAHKQPREVYCVGFVRREVEAGRAWAVRAGLAAIAGAPALADRVVAYSDFLLRPWVLAVGEAGVRDVARLVRALGRGNPFKVIEEAGGGTEARRALRELILKEGAA